MDPRIQNQPRVAPADAAPEAAQRLMQRAPSDDAMIEAMLGKAEAPAKQVRPVPATAQGDRPKQKSLPEDNASDGDILDEEEEDDLEDGNPPANVKDDGTDAEAGDDADEGDDEDEDDADPLDDLFADHDRDEDGKGDALDASKLGDNAKLSVTVDGEEKQVTLGELKRRYAGEGAIEKRLQEATEARKHAVEDYDRSKTLVMGVLQTMGQALFRRTIPAPSEELRRVNPTQFLLQKDQYDAETRALAEQQARIQDTIQAAEDAHTERQQRARQEAAIQLRQMMPVLADPVKGPKVRGILIDTAREIGYTDEQIAACSDPLMFKLMALAAREIRRAKKVKVQKAVENPRTVAPRGSQNRDKRVVDAKTREKRSLAAARKNPTEDNLLATMLVAPPKKPRRR